MSDESKSTEESAPADDSGKRSAESDPESTATDKKAKRADRRVNRKEAGAKVKKGADAVRNRIAAAIWLVAVVCALFLAVGALLIALDANQNNVVVQFVLDGAALLDGPFSRQNGVFTFEGSNAATKNALVNWGIAAIAYLVVGKILDRIIRP